MILDASLLRLTLLSFIKFTLTIVHPLHDDYSRVLYKPDFSEEKRTKFAKCFIEGLH